MSASPDSSSFDLRRKQREARARPWLTNSILRGRSTTSSSGVNGSEDAPLLPAATTVTTASDPLPPTTVLCASEKQGTDIAEKEQAPACLFPTSAKAAGSKIPRLANLVALSRPCGSTSLDGEGDCGKSRTPATSPTVTGETTFASRIPIRVKTSFAGRRSASPQMRPSRTLVAHGGLPVDKKVGKVRGPEGYLSGVLPNAPHAMSIQSCINPEPIKTHRIEYALKSILKHRAETSEEMELPPPSSAGNGVTSNPAKKKVCVDVTPTFAAAACWPKGLFKTYSCMVCHYEACRCVYSPLQAHQDWLEHQLVLGHDYLKHSGGMLGGMVFTV